MRYLETTNLSSTEREFMELPGPDEPRERRLSEEAKALNRIADAIELLARATAGEFDAGGEERLPRSLGER